MRWPTRRSPRQRDDEEVGAAVDLLRRRAGVERRDAERGRQRGAVGDRLAERRLELCHPGERQRAAFPVEIEMSDSRAVRALMGMLGQSRHLVISAEALFKLRATFSADHADEQETAASMRTMLRETGQLIDPHGAVGVAVAEKETRDPSVPMVVLGTAHAAKFPDAVEAACGVCPRLPDWLADLGERPERVTALRVDQTEIERHILSRSRAAHQGAGTDAAGELSASSDTPSVRPRNLLKDCVIALDIVDPPHLYFVAGA